MRFDSSIRNAMSSLVYVAFIFFIIAFSQHSLAVQVSEKILSTYIQKQLKDKPIADYKTITEKDASAIIDISKVVNFAWDKAVIFDQLSFQEQICHSLTLDKDECKRYRFDELVKTKNYFIVFSNKHRVVYTEVFDDEILLFGINTVGIERTPAKPMFTAYHDITVKHRTEQAQINRYLSLALMILLPVCGAILGVKLPRAALVIATFLVAPMALVIFGLFIGAGNPIGFGLLAIPAFISFLTGIAMFIASMYVKIKNPQFWEKTTIQM